MQEILAITLAAMQHDAARVERVSSNLANATTPAYKREVFLQRPIPVDASGLSFTQAVSRAATQSGERRATGAMPTFEIVRDMKAGTLRPTRQNLDLALAGPGYFEVATESGPAYTRHGQFQLDARGRLVTPQGHPVMGHNGEIVLTDAQPTIDGNGNITERGRLVAQLKIVEFEQTAALQSLEGGLYASSMPARSLRSDEIQVRQGHLENPNINSMTEMVELMQTMRHFESLQKTVQGYDEMVGSAIRKLGDL
jgi:flagellar basal-body rod protein FlgF